MYPSFINLQSHAFLQTYSTILPTSLAYSGHNTKGFSPWRPDAVMGTNKNDGYLGILDHIYLYDQLPSIFMDKPWKLLHYFIDVSLC